MRRDHRHRGISWMPFSGAQTVRADLRGRPWGYGRGEGSCGGGSSQWQELPGSWRFGRAAAENGEAAELTPEQKAWLGQEATLNNLGTIAEDARLFAQDTSARVLQLGFPL